MFQFCMSINVLHLIDKVKYKNYKIISIEKENHLIKYPTSIHDKNSLNFLERTNLNIIKLIYTKPTANTILSGENLKAFPLEAGKGEEANSCHFCLI